MNLIRTITVAMLIVTNVGPALSQQVTEFDGLYYPTDTPGWTCNPDHIGLDGGALSIGGGYLDGLENRCDLTVPVRVVNGTRFTAVCSAEGSTYSEPITITPTSDGVMIKRDGSTAFWNRCDRKQKTAAAPQPSNGRWVMGFAQGVTESSSQDAKGNAITFTCFAGEEGGLYVELGGRPIAGGLVEFDVDGVGFSMSVWADGGRIATDCNVCGDNYSALWRATATGRLMTVRASDGQSATFGLNGSRDALGDVVCRPDDGG